MITKLLSWKLSIIKTYYIVIKDCKTASYKNWQSRKYVIFCDYKIVWHENCSSWKYITFYDHKIVHHENCLTQKHVIIFCDCHTSEYPMFNLYAYNIICMNSVFVSSYNIIIIYKLSGMCVWPKYVFILHLFKLFTKYVVCNK